MTPYMGRRINEIPKGTSLGKDVIWRIDRKIGRPARPVRVTKRPKKAKKPNTGKLAIRRDHSRSRIEMKFCVVGGLQGVILRFKFHRHWLRGFGAVGVAICPFPLTWPLAYTTGCTTVQAVILAIEECNWRSFALKHPMSTILKCRPCNDSVRTSLMSSVRAHLRITSWKRLGRTSGDEADGPRSIQGFVRTTRSHSSLSWVSHSLFIIC